MKIISALLALMLAQNLYAACGKNAFNTLNDSETIHIDVLGKYPVQLNLKVPAGVEPETKIVGEDVGFECEVKQSRFLAVDGENDQRCYQVDINWEPGADLSGCMVEVTAGKQKSRAYLFMMY
ncbi:MAG: hypothetical protein HOE90_21900 [Bacteriovoracaceae bacterium]|jgi:hypothetical protein|nr:hypothetical protein [Bacteriovoracaceae bacterium]